MILENAPSDDPLESTDAREAFDALFRDSLTDATIESPAVPSFPRPKHGEWDLDELVAKYEGPVAADPLPHWIRQLTQAEATRLLQICDTATHLRPSTTEWEREVETFFQYTSYFQNRPTERDRAITKIYASPAEGKKQAMAWLKRHNQDDMPEETGVYVNKPGLLRIQEQKLLVKPNLKRIVLHHFLDHPTPPENRTLMDIGSWDGEIPYALRNQLPNAVAVEQNEERFHLLTARESDRFRCVNASIQDIMANPALCPAQPDAIYMGHIHYFLQQDESDYQSLDWMMQTLRSGGIGIVTLNDLFRESHSRADLRRALGVHESNPNPEQYRQYLEKQGMTVRVMRPTLNIKAKTDKGFQAMRDIMRFLLPGESRHRHYMIDDYLNDIRKSDGILKHTLYMMTAYKSGAAVPVQEPYLPEELNGGTRRLARKPVAMNAQLRRPPMQKNLSCFEPVASLAALSPTDVLDMLDTICEMTDGGTYDGFLTQILGRLQLHRVDYLELVQRRNEIEAAAARGDATIAFFHAAKKKISRQSTNGRQGHARQSQLSPDHHQQTVADSIRALFPRGLPSAMALHVAGLHFDQEQRNDSDIHVFTRLGKLAAAQRRDLVAKMQSTNVMPIRSLIASLLSLSDLVQ